MTAAFFSQDSTPSDSGVEPLSLPNSSPTPPFQDGCHLQEDALEETLKQLDLLLVQMDQRREALFQCKHRVSISQAINRTSQPQRLSSDWLKAAEEAHSAREKMNALRRAVVIQRDKTAGIRIE